MSDDHRFQVDLRGVIDLLSHHLYSGPEVYVREMLQNAVDAIVARGQVEPGHRGDISLQIVESKDDHRPTLVVHDNGIGLTEDEVHRFLATIGQSSKRESLQREDFIGQFGIGLLSGFVVSEEIVVITRSIKAESPAVEWRGRSDGTYSLRTFEGDFEPGTQVYLRAKPGCSDFFEPEYVRDMAKHFGSMLPFTIEVSGVVSGVTERWIVNEDPPWRLQYANDNERREALLEYGREVFESDFFDAIPLHSDVGGIEGVAFVLPYSTSLARKRTHRVYLKNMLLSEQVENLMPEWSFFVTCVVNATELRPTASRESFYEDDDLAAARDALGNCLRNYLVEMAQTDLRRLNHLIALHCLAIKALALEDDEFFRMFARWLSFETSLGSMTLNEYLKENPVVRYVATVEEFRQISSVAAAQSMCVINGGYVYDVDLLERLPAVLDIQVERIDGSDLTQRFEELTLAQREDVFEFVKFADLVLQPLRCLVRIKKFQPAELPALYTSNDAATFLRSVDRSKDVADAMWSDVLDRVAEGRAASSYAELCLNYHNPLIRKVAQLSDRKLMQQSVEMLYVQSLLMGHHPLRAQEMSLLNRGLLGLIEYGVDLLEENEP